MTPGKELIIKSPVILCFKNTTTSFATGRSSKRVSEKNQDVDRAYNPTLMRGGKNKEYKAKKVDEDIGFNSDHVRMWNFK